MLTIFFLLLFLFFRISVVRWEAQLQSSFSVSGQWWFLSLSIFNCNLMKYAIFVFKLIVLLVDVNRKTNPSANSWVEKDFCSRKMLTMSCFIICLTFPLTMTKNDFPFVTCVLCGFCKKERLICARAVNHLLFHFEGALHHSSPSYVFQKNLTHVFVCEEWHKA